MLHTQQEALRLCIFVRNVSLLVLVLLVVTVSVLFLLHNRHERCLSEDPTVHRRLLNLSSAKDHAMASLAAPRVRLPQGTYVGSIVSVGQNIVEAAGMGLGVGASAPTDGRARRDLRTVAAQAPLPKVVEAFLGIPYAQSTAGANRFRAPKPLSVRPGDADMVHPAIRLGECCPGTAVNLFVVEGEDCLNVNVYRPRSKPATTTAKAPVVVYVHGGAFNKGMGAERDMASFVGYAGPDIVGVSFNYRVGALGFLGWVDGDGNEQVDEAPLNAGLLDQQALFAWVTANIGAFGGDPDQVTVMGLSAGAHSIGHHLLYYAPGKAPFHKAILESGGPTARAVWGATHPRPQQQLRQFLAEAGVDPQDVATSRGVAYLRTLPLRAIVAATQQVWTAYSASVCWPFQPVVGGRVIPAPPTTVWQSGFRPSIPLLMGFASNEGTLFVPGDRAHADTDADFRTFLTTLVPGLADERDSLDMLASLYPDPVADASSRYVMARPFPAGITGQQWERLEAAYAHYAYICPVLQTAHFAGVEALSGHSAEAPVFVYEFAAHALAWNTSNHGDHQAVVAHSMAGLRGCPGLVAVADAMHGAWVAFAVGAFGRGGGRGAVLGVPGSGRVAWAPWTRAAQLVLVFGAGNDEKVPAEARQGGSAPKRGTVAQKRTLTADEQAQCAFWWARAGLSEGDGRRAAKSSEKTSRL